MKYKIQLISLVIMIFFLSVKTFSQNKFQEEGFISIENNEGQIDYIREDIILFSILNLNDPMELEKLNTLAGKYKNKKITFILITDDNNEKEINLLKEKLSNYKFLSKKENDKIFNTYQTGMYKIFPIQILINKKGKVKYKKKGRTGEIENKLSKRIDRLLENN